MKEYPVKFKVNGEWKDMIQKGGDDMEQALTDAKSKIFAEHGVVSICIYNPDHL